MENKSLDFLNARELYDYMDSIISMEELYTSKPRTNNTIESDFISVFSNQPTNYNGVVKLVTQNGETYPNECNLSVTIDKFLIIVSAVDVKTNRLVCGFNFALTSYKNSEDFWAIIGFNTNGINLVIVDDREEKAYKDSIYNILSIFVNPDGTEIDFIKNLKDSCKYMEEVYIAKFLDYINNVEIIPSTQCFNLDGSAVCIYYVYNRNVDYKERFYNFLGLFTVEYESTGEVRLSTISTPKEIDTMDFFTSGLWYFTTNLFFKTIDNYSGDFTIENIITPQNKEFMESYLQSIDKSNSFKLFNGLYFYL